MEVKRKLANWAIIATILAGINTWFIHSLILGIIVCVIYLLCVGAWIGKLLPGTFARGEALGWGILLLLTVLILLNVIVYYPYKITNTTSFVVIVLPLFLFFLQQNSKHETEEQPVSKEPFPYTIPTIIYFIFELALIGFIISKRTVDVLPSPWLAFKPWFFAFYAFTTAFLIYLVSKSNRVFHTLALTSIHLFSTYAIVPIMYTLGYGFDGFIHRVTELWIQNNGFIEPKNPFYIGQYGLVVWLANITHISTNIIDIYLAPVLASLILPFIVVYVLKKVWSLPSSVSANLVWIFSFVYFLALFLTTPHNIAILFLIITTFTSIAYLKNKLPFVIPLLISIASVTIHPLLGAPTFTFVCFMWLFKRFETKKIINWFIIFLGGLILALLPAIMFAVYLFISGKGFPTFTNPLHHIHQFFDLFKMPYWYAKTSPFIYELLYFWQRCIAGVAIVLGLIGFAYTLAKERKKELLFFPISMFAFWAGAFFLHSWIVFPDVPAFDQGNYPLRLLTTSIIFILPWSMFAVYKIGSWIFTEIHLRTQKFKFLAYIACLSFVAMLLTVSFYLSYPQRNAKAHFPGFNVTQYDMQAAQWIHNDNAEYNYIVLANSLTSVAALSQYSFAKYFDTTQGKLSYYDIPAGGILYSYYDKMIYQGQKREYMNEAMDIAGVEKSYFVVNWYWDKFRDIVEGAKKTADSWQSIGDGKIYIFTYTK